MTLIVTNGDSAAARIQTLGPDAEILPWRDVLHDGPVLAADDLPSQSRLRAAFLADMAARDVAAVEADLAARDGRYLDALRAGETVELWFEHDLYDQLQLAQLVWAAEVVGLAGGLKLCQTDTHLTSLEDSAFAALAGTARPLTQDEIDAATRFWRAFTSPAPAALNDFVAKPPVALPHLLAAAVRQMAEHPDVASGLPLSLSLACEPLLDGAQTIGALFRHMQSREAAAFMGDWSFAVLISEAAEGVAPLFKRRDSAPLMKRWPPDRDWFAQEVVLTDHGRLCLAGDADHLRANGIDRWRGGVRVTREQPVFYDPATRRLVDDDGVVWGKAGG